MKKKQRKEAEPPSLPVAVSRLVGTYLGGMSFGATYLVAVLSGVRAPTALLRSVIVWACFLIAGRLLGFFVGKALERALVPHRPDSEIAA